MPGLLADTRRVPDGPVPSSKWSLQYFGRWRTNGYTGHPELRDATLRVYRTATGKLVQWSKTARVRSADDLTRAKLMAFREQSIAASKQVRHGQHGHRTATEGGRRSPHTVNKQLRAVRAVLGYLVDLDLFARLSHDDLRRSLKRLPAPVERLDYLKPKALHQIAFLRGLGGAFDEAEDLLTQAEQVVPGKGGVENLANHLRKSLRKEARVSTTEEPSGSE